MGSVGAAQSYNQHSALPCDACIACLCMYSVWQLPVAALCALQHCWHTPCLPACRLPNPTLSYAHMQFGCLIERHPQLLLCLSAPSCHSFSSSVCQSIPFHLSQPQSLIINFALLAFINPAPHTCFQTAPLSPSQAGRSQPCLMQPEACWQQRWQQESLLGVTPGLTVL